jgi:hypothetical protein
MFHWVVKPQVSTRQVVCKPAAGKVNRNILSTSPLLLHLLLLLCAPVVATSDSC